MFLAWAFSWVWLGLFVFGLGLFVGLARAFCFWPGPFRGFGRGLSWVLAEGYEAKFGGEKISENDAQ